MAEGTKVSEIRPGARDQHGRGGDDGGNSMEARVAKLEAGVEHIQSGIQEIKTDVREIKKDAKEDFRILFGALIFAALGLAALMAKGFKWF